MKQYTAKDLLKWGGFILFLPITLPIAVIWYIWKKTSWSNRSKSIVTGLIAVLFLFLSYSEGKKESQINQASSTPSVEVGQEMAPVNTQEQKEVVVEKLYKVETVVDGDTIKVDMDGKSETLRLIGIDTPETVDPRKPVQCFGEEASKKAKETLTGKTVRLEADPTQGERDKYQRLLRYVYLEDGISFNKWMIDEGYAHEYTYQSNPYKYQADFKDAERSARENKKGLWNETTCNGDTTVAAALVTAGVVSSLVSESDSNSLPVKKSTSSICHAPGTTYYAKTKNFVPYNTVDECLNSGGRLPKK